MAVATLSYEYNPLEASCEVWINEDVACSPPLELPSYLKDRIENRKRKIWESKQDISLAEAKRKAILNGRVRRLSDKSDQVKKTVQENVEQKKNQAEKTIKKMNTRLKNAECKRSSRLQTISVRCKQKVADAKMKRLENIARQEEEREERLEAIKEKLAAGIARRNTELRNKQLRSLAACRWCAARRIQLWWHTMMLKTRLREFLVTCPAELLGKKDPASYYDLRRILISRNNIRASSNLLKCVYRFNPAWKRKAGPRILLTCFMIKYFPKSVLAYNGEHEQNLIAKGEELARKFRKLVQHPAAHYRTMYQSVCSFGACWAEYNAALDAWKRVDIDRLVEELMTYWEQLQEVKQAMTLRAVNAANSIDIPGAEDEISDSNAILDHITSQEEMVIQRLRQTGGEIAVTQLRERFGLDEERGEESIEERGEESTEERGEVRSEERREDEKIHSGHLTDHSETEHKEEEANQVTGVEDHAKSDQTEPKPGLEEQSLGHEDQVKGDDRACSSKDEEFYDDMVKMEMTHEIVMNDGYKIKKQQQTGIAGQIEATLKQVFWDVLRTEISEGNYTQCVTLLAEIRDQIESIGTIETLPPTHHFRVLIADTIDIPLIKQQIDHGTFDMGVKVEGIVNILLRLCTAARDPEIRLISQITDTVEIFKALYDAIEQIKLDIANFYLEQAKTTIKQHSIEYERKKFGEFFQKHPDGLDKTKAWLSSNTRDSPLNTMNAAYLSLLSHPPPNPETASLDQGRFREVSATFHTLLLSSIIQLKLSSLHPDFNEHPFLRSLHSTLLIIAAPAPRDSETDDVSRAPETPQEEMSPSDETGIFSEDQQQRILLKITEICLEKVSTVNETLLNRVLSDTLASVLACSQPGDVTVPDPVVKLLHSRLAGYLTQVTLNRKVGVPKGFQLIEGDVEMCGMAYGKLVDFNRKVYGPYYARILKDLGESN